MIEVSQDKFVKYIKNRVRGKGAKNFLGICTGSTGSGKSYHMLALAEKIDPDFGINRVSFTAKEMMKIINSGELMRGNVIIPDEFGTQHFCRNFQSIGNIMTNFLLQTFRKSGYIFLPTTPSLGFIDKASRILFHAHFHMNWVDYKKDISYSTPYFLQFSQYKNKVYRKFLRVYDSNRHKYIAIKELAMNMPSKELIVQYEAKKDRFIKSLSEKIENAIIKQDQKDSGVKELTEQQKQVVLLLKEKYNINQVSDRLGIGLQSVYEHIGLIKRKGVVIKPIKEGLKVKYYEVSGF